MKKIQFLGLLLLIVAMPYTGNAQKHSLEEVSISPPTLQYGQYDNLSDLLQESIKQPSNPGSKPLLGTELIRFSVTTAGTIEDIDVIQSVSSDIDKATIRILNQTSGKWEPGSINGQPAKMTREVKLSFVNCSYEDMIRTAKKQVEKGNACLFSKNDPGKALKHYDQAYLLIPDEPVVLTMKAFCLAKLGRTEEAQEIWDRLEARPTKKRAILESADDELAKLL